MNATAQHVEGLIEVPADESWSADAIVEQCLGIRTHAWEHERFIIAGRLPASQPFESTRLIADLPQLRSDLHDLLDEFLLLGQR